MSIETRLKVALLAVSLFQGTAVSSVLWTQAPLTTEANANNHDITAFAQANDFQLNATYSLTGFTVWLADRAQSGILDGTLDNFGGTLGWAIFADAGTAPGSLLFSGNDLGPAILSTGLFTNPGSRELFHVDSTFGGPLVLGPGSYWLSVRDGGWGSVSGGDVVGWVRSMPVDLNPRVSDTNEANPSAWTTSTVDLAFSIFGNPVPEPGTVFLLAAGAIAARRRNHRRADKRKVIA